MEVAEPECSVHKNRMKLSEYWAGRPVELHTLLPVDAATQRLNASAGSPRNPFFRGVVGFCRDGRLSLRRMTPLVHSVFKPVLEAKLEASRGGTTISGKFGMSALLKGFLPIWYAFLVLVGIVQAFALNSIVVDPLYARFAAVLFPVLLVGPLLLALFESWRAERQLADITAFLEREIQVLPGEGLRQADPA